MWMEPFNFESMNFDTVFTYSLHALNHFEIIDITDGWLAN